MGEVLNHIARHAAMEAAKGAGCMVTLLAMLTGIGTIFCILGLIILKCIGLHWNECGICQN